MYDTQERQAGMITLEFSLRRRFIFPKLPGLNRIVYSTITYTSDMIESDILLLPVKYPAPCKFKETDT